ncbi:Aste57867_648 [Aphanomyces stellatus]|uniref:Aste57867_648 protein n=1 Tax=Aphanomyces stellatus TaxID=120398 RepID=A0A485K860_9STRA|nr:hypothetical protein As57867_000647 [Aphanomyces stellatus]VFT77873.1 Aste57867_648 [Aphanomyces stellatus]
MADDWTFVGRKGKASRKPPFKQQPPVDAKEATFAYKHKAGGRNRLASGDEKKAHALLAKVKRIVDLMRLSPFHTHLIASLDAEMTVAATCPMQLVCYGLGSFNSNNAAYQLACASLIREWMTAHDAIELKHALLYDPIMTQDDNDVATGMGFDVLSTNEQGQRRADLKTLFFMPHCGKKLYQNVLLTNWGEDLRHIVLLGNSFAAYDDRVVAAADRCASIFSAVLPYLREVSVGKVSKSWDEYVQYDAAFNDMSLHVFPPEMLQRATADGIFERPVDEFDVGTDEDLM